GIMRGAVGLVPADDSSRQAVGGDHVARTGRRAADGVAVRSRIDPDAIEQVAARGRAGGVRADVVALNHISKGGRAAALGSILREEDAIGLIAGDYVAVAGLADEVAGGPAEDDHAAEAVAQDRFPGCIEA